MPSPGGSVSEMGACHLVGLPEGYHTADRGRSCRCLVRIRREAAHGRPRGRDFVQVSEMALAGRRTWLSRGSCDQICDQNAATRTDPTRDE